MYEYLDRRYALALYEVADKNGKIEEYIKELKDVANLIKSNKEFSEVVRHPEITTAKKKKIFKEVFQGQIDEYLMSFLLILIEKDRILYLEQKIKQMEKIHRQRQNIVVAHVKTVIALNENEKDILTRKLHDKYNKNILLKTEIDKDLIGGIYIRVGDDVIDGSIKNKFEELKKEIKRKHYRKEV